MTKSILSDGHGIVKKLRKGTRSCLECRRRKARCIYPDGESTCFSCVARQSRCIGQGQQHDDVRDNASPAAELTTQARTRGRRIQTYLQKPVDSDVAQESSLSLVAIKDTQRAPVVSILIDAKLSRHTEKVQAPILEEAQRDINSSSSADNSGSVRLPHTNIQHCTRDSAGTCATLRSALPNYDEIQSIFSCNGYWWSGFHQKAYAIAGTPAQTLQEFAQRTYTSSHPADLGALAVAVARSSIAHRQLYSLVDDIVISNLTYLATQKGLELVILLAKSYTDGGQPKRAWLVWRKALAAAQLMGLACGARSSVTEQRLWLAIYHGDRFCSLLLGLPYGVNDTHYKSTFDAVTTSMAQLPTFVLKCAMLVGKIIDRNLTPGKPSLAKAIELDEELDSLASRLPRDWWSIPTELPQNQVDCDSLREQLLQQFYFFWVKLYLHLPFLVKSSANLSQSVGRASCMEAARQVLSRYRLFRAQTEMGFALFECKTTDFACFTAAVILLVGNFHCNHVSSSPELSKDLNLVAAVDQILHREETEKGCQLAVQCRKTLDVLIGNHSQDVSPAELAADFREVSIPYFGVIIRKRIEPQSPPRQATNNIQHPQSNADSGTLFELGLESWDMSTFSLEYVYPDFDLGSMGYQNENFPQDESLQSFNVADMEWAAGWGILTDIDMLPAGGNVAS